MGFERSPFGDGSASGSGNVTTAVSNHYNSRRSGFAAGNVKTEGREVVLSIHFDHAAATDDELFLANPVIPAGSRITQVVMITRVQGVVEAGGVVDIGTDTSEATNGFTITEAQLEAAADVVVDLTGALSGTWDAEAKLAADTIVNVALTVATASAGEWEVEITYQLARAA